MDRAYTVNFPQAWHDVDWKAAQRNIHVGFGGLAMEMLPFDKKIGTIALTDESQGRMRTDAGVVLSSCPTVLDIQPGDVALAIYIGGHWWEGFSSGDYVAKNTVKFYGTQSKNEFLQECENPDDIIVAVLNEGETVQARGQWLLIKREPLITEISGIELIDKSKYRSCRATVVSAGSGYVKNGVFIPCEYLPGDTILYNGRALVVNTFGSEDYLGEDWADYAFIKQQDVLSRVEV